jgi:hypothetical protein
VRVPWGKIESSPTDFIDPKYLPEGIRITQSYHMRLDDVNDLLEHWTKRQAAGKKPFRFKSMKRAARRSKEASGNRDEPQRDKNGVS